MKKTSQMVIGSLLGLLFGGGIFYVWDTHEQEEREKREMKERHDAQRKAHHDSLMMIRAKQDAKEQEQQAEDRVYAAVVGKLKNFYLDSVLIERPKLHNRMFGLQKSTADELKLLRNRLQILHDSGDWYKVKLVGLQGTMYRYVKVATYGKEIILEEVR